MQGNVHHMAWGLSLSRFGGFSCRPNFVVSDLPGIEDVALDCSVRHNDDDVNIPRDTFPDNGICNIKILKSQSTHGNHSAKFVRRHRSY